jgi:hypothetical protein
MHPIAGQGDGSSCPQWNQKVEPTWSFRLKGFDFVVVISTTVQGQAGDSLAPPGAAGFLPPWWVALLHRFVRLLLVSAYDLLDHVLGEHAAAMKPCSFIHQFHNRLSPTVDKYRDCFRHVSEKFPQHFVLVGRLL